MWNAHEPGFGCSTTPGTCADACRLQNCSVARGSASNSAYPCRCGSAVCGTHQTCTATTSTCEDSISVDHLQSTMTITYFGVERNVSFATGLGSCQPLDFHITQCQPGSHRCSRSWCLVGPECKLDVLHAKSDSVSGHGLRYSFETCYDNAEACQPESSKTWHRLDHWCDYDVSSLATYFVLALFVLVTCLFALRLGCFIMSFRRCGLFHWLGDGLIAAWRSLATTDSDGQLTAQAKHLAEQWRVRRACNSMDFISMAGYILFCIYVTHSLMSGDYFNRDAYLRHARTGVEAIRVLASMPLLEGSMIVSVSLACGSHPQLCTARLLDACMALFGLASATRPLFFVVDSDYLCYGSLLWLLRFILSLCWGNGMLNITLAVAASLCTVLNKLLTDFPASWGRTSIAAWEFFLLITFVTMIAGVSSYNAKCAKSHLQDHVADQQCSTITTLLDSMCDAVIRLDSDFCFLDPQPKLEALLQANPGSLHKCSFLELLPVQESNRARKALLEGSQHSAGCLHTTMLNSSGMQVRVQVFHVCMHSLTEGVLHMAGVKEYSSELALPLSLESAEVLDPSDALSPFLNCSQAAHPPLDQLDDEADFFRESSSVASNSETCPASSAPICEDDGVNEAWLDCTPELELLVIYRSPSFSRMLGVSRTKKLKLAQHMTVGGHADFSEWIQSSRESATTESKVVWLFCGKDEELTRFLVRPISTESTTRFGYIMKSSYLGLTFEHAPAIHL
eukprot:TRINITY_DN13412_c0_g1_i1.p1 TRINITY_DN13412_c0_g1~~TRINITY_DN13412_c0_g1_i1.p1  ORF type:complete len:792 (+),score=88.54 TRINITY_DN13412_c0_g1_i1:167-2377(+)